MNDTDLVRTIILQAPNFIGFILCVFVLWSQNRALVALTRDLISRCDCRESREKIADAIPPIPTTPEKRYPP